MYMCTTLIHMCILSNYISEKYEKYNYFFLYARINIAKTVAAKVLKMKHYTSYIAPAGEQLGYICG